MPVPPHVINRLIILTIIITKLYFWFKKEKMLFGIGYFLVQGHGIGIGIGIGDWGLFLEGGCGGG